MELKNENQRLQVPDGRALGYAQYGDPQGKPLLYFHGGVSSRLDIAFADQICKKAQVRIIAPDRPGTGISTPMIKEPLSLDSWAKDVGFLIDELELGKVPLLAWSLAGPYAFNCAYRLPEKIGRIACSGVAVDLDQEEHVASLGLLIDRLLLHKSAAIRQSAGRALQISALLPAAVLKTLILQDLSCRADREIVSALSAEDATRFFYESLRQGPAGVLADYAAAAGVASFELSDLKQKVLLMHGSEDRLCPISNAESLALQIPESRLQKVPGQGHFLLHRHLQDALEFLFE